MSVNSVSISGNLTRDPELTATQGGTQILRFGVAVNDRRQNLQTGAWEDYANYIDCTCFGNRAVALSKFLVKGMKVAVSGRLHYSSWTEKDSGKKRSKIEVVANEVDVMQKPRDGRQAAQPQPPYQAPAPVQAVQQPPQYAPAPPAQQQLPYAQPQAAPAISQAPAGYQPQQPVYATPPQAGVYDEDIPF